MTAMAHLAIDLPAPEPRPSGEVPPSTVTSDDALDPMWELLESLPVGHPARLDARNDIVARHMPLVSFLARRYRDRGESIEDLIQVGSVGLIKSVDRFDRHRGVAFSTFATPTILGEIKRHFRDKTWMVRVPRGLQELKARLASAREELSQQLSRSPTIAELAAFMDLTQEQVLEGLDAANAYSATSIDAPHTGDGSIGTSIADHLGAADDALDLVERRHCVAPLLDSLPERERQIIFLRFFRDKTQIEIAEELGLSQMHVSRLLSQTLSRLHDKLSAELDV
jgi:RNA polymerase sigma-B factor